MANKAVGEWMPILGAGKASKMKAVPMAILDEAHAQKIHGQSLDRLRQRGGLSAYELILNLEKILPIGRRPSLDDEAVLEAIVRERLDSKKVEDGDTSDLFVMEGVRE